MPSANPLVLGSAALVGTGLVLYQMQRDRALEAEAKQEAKRRSRIAAMDADRTECTKERDEEENMRSYLLQMRTLESRLDELREMIDTDGTDAFFVRVPLLGDSPDFAEYAALALLGDEIALDNFHRHDKVQPEYATMQVSKRSAKMLLEWFTALAHNQGNSSFYLNAGILASEDSKRLCVRGEWIPDTSAVWCSTSWNHTELQLVHTLWCASREDEPIFTAVKVETRIDFVALVALADTLKLAWMPAHAFCREKFEPPHILKGFSTNKHSQVEREGYAYVSSLRLG